MNISEFKNLPILGILRGAKQETIAPLTECIISSGLKTVEITMNSDDAPSQIRQMVLASDRKLTIGAGTVLNLDDMHKALDAGATFIVSPTLVTDVVKYCKENSIPVFPGAFTPQEIFNAWEAGATYVKVFPAKFFGPDYLKEIKGPFNNIDLLACGGVTAENIQAFFDNGASAVSFGSSIFKKEWLDNREFGKIKTAIKDLIFAAS